MSVEIRPSVLWIFSVSDQKTGALAEMGCFLVTKES